MATLYVGKTGGALQADAGRDVNLTAPVITNSGDGGGTVIAAGRDIHMGTVATERQDSTVWNEVTHVKRGSSLDVGTEIAVAGDVNLVAGNDLTATAARVVSSSGQLEVTAGHDIQLRAGEASEMSDIAYQDTSYSLFSAKTTTTWDAYSDTTALGSTFSADGVELGAGRDMSLQGGQVVASRDVSLRAEGDITLSAATNVSDEHHFKDVSESGVFGTGGLSVSLGTRQQSADTQSRQVTTARSTVGSLEGDVRIEAGKTYIQQGSDVLAPQGDVDIAASDISVLAAEEQSRTRQESRYKQTGVTLALSSPIITALETGQHMARAARDTGDDRMTALAATATGLAGYDAYTAYRQNPAQVGGLNVSIFLGASKSESTTIQARQSAAGSTLVAGGDVRLHTEREGEAGGDIFVVGSSVSAGNDASLHAGNDILLTAGKNVYTQQSQSSSSGASVGIGFTLSDRERGFTLNLGMNEGSGRIDSTDIVHGNTFVQAGNRTNLESGGGTTLEGAVVEGAQVTATVGGDFIIESVHDTSDYDSRQNSAGASVNLCIPPLCTGVTSGSVDTRDSKAQGSYASVAAQSGIKAGGRGFDIEVYGNTGLKGGLMAGSAPESNRLVTATLTTEDLANSAEASAEASSLSMSSEMLTQGKYGAAKALIANTSLNANRAGSASGQTRSAIAAGNVTITDSAEQAKLTGHTAEDTVARLNRDTDTAQTAASRQDVATMQRQVEAEQEIKQAVYAGAVKFTYESYRKIFLQEHPVYELLRDEDGHPLIDENTGKQKLRLLSEEEKRNLKPGPDGKIDIAANGIFNDEQAAAKYALQHASGTGPQYMVYFPEANNALSELLVAGYQKFLEGDMLGLSNSAVQVKDAMALYGQSGLHMDGHSRGSMTIGNALESIADAADKRGALSGTTVNFFGPAYNAADADILLSGLQNRTAFPEENQVGMVLKYQTHVADPVGRLIGGNPPTGGTIPQGSGVLKEMVRAVTGHENTAHNLYFVDRDNFKPETDKLIVKSLVNGYWGGKTPILSPAR